MGWRGARGLRPAEPQTDGIFTGKDDSLTKPCRADFTAGTRPLQDCDVYIGRGSSIAKLTKSKWGNPFRVWGCRTLALDKYRQWLWKQEALIQALPELTGKRLVCATANQRTCVMEMC